MKKLFGVITIASCMLFSALPVKAITDEGMDAFLNEPILTFSEMSKNPAAITVNEYDSLPEKIYLDKENENITIKSINHNDSISKSLIKDYTLSRDKLAYTKVRELNKLDDLKLQNMGYNEDSINLIRKISTNEISPTSTQYMALFASLTIIPRDGTLDANNSGFVIYDWSWDKAPVLAGLHDTIAFGWGKNMTRTGYNVRLKRSDMNTRTYIRDETFNYITDSSANPGCSSTFRLTDNGQVALSGRAYLQLKSYDSYVDGVEITFAYAHPTINFGGVSVSWSGASIDISSNADIFRSRSAMFH